ncbi:DUF6998 domain-containing protein [Mycolicibacterium arenosum]|uniref:DUF6998 domain-containing protein n=1 Tax=Mycolicibacterium arenosum TaxID=2952157 RepID=UPI0038CDBE6E
MSRRSDANHEVVYNGPFAFAAEQAGAVGTNGQAPIGLNRLRALNVRVRDGDRVPHRRLSSL